MLLPLIRLAYRNEKDSILSEQVNGMNSRKNKVQYALRSRCVEILRDVENLRASGISNVRIIIFYSLTNQMIDSHFDH
jgi:hypothetical protein